MRAEREPRERRERASEREERLLEAKRGIFGIFKILTQAERFPSKARGVFVFVSIKYRGALCSNTP